MRQIYRGALYHARLMQMAKRAACTHHCHAWIRPGNNDRSGDFKRTRSKVKLQLLII